MPVRLNGSTSGYTELDAPAVAGNNTIKMPASNGAAYQLLRNGATAGTLEYTDNIVSGTAQNSTSGTSIDFTGIPSWVKRVTVMFAGVSMNASSTMLLRVGDSSGIKTTGYVSGVNDAANYAYSTIGFILDPYAGAAVDASHGHIVLVNLTGNTWTSAGNLYRANSSLLTAASAGSVALSSTLDRIRITTVNGTDTFDAGTINILYE